MYPFLRSLNAVPPSSWDDLERAIVALPSEQARGDAFEEFCQAYFTLQKDLYQTVQTWRWSETPLNIIQRLGCSAHDEGIDGVLVHHDGTITAYQAKFRTNRSNLPSQHELSTFYMVSDRADYRLVISNAEDLPRIARERKDHGQILIDTLLQLEQEFFTRLQGYVCTEQVTQEPPPTPKPFQVQAINAITEGLVQHSRGQAVLACGSGKTLIGKWVADRQEARWVLVMVPSLALVRQTLEEWHRARTEAFRYICICSDETVKLRGGHDEWELTPSDLDIKVSTTASDLVAFLQRTDPLASVVFSTYQSSPVIVEALKDPKLLDFRFDLTLCDEAHRLAGVTGRTFSQVLHEKLIRSKKRLFMTATPRVLSPRFGSKNSEESAVVISMNDPSTFGPVLYRFTFAQAIQEKIICDYYIVIIGVAEEEITRLVRTGGTVQIEDSETWQAESLAQRIALGKAIANYGLEKVFTFHNRVQAAERFVDSRLPDSFPAVLNRMKPELRYVALHINGEMSTAIRSRILREFRMSPRGVISNARCLGEGVNVPIVEGVFFADPRESVIDIVQATGRALRRIPGKEYAYIIIPVLVSGDEDAEEILEDSRFHTVWKVLSAMVSQDDRLEAVIRDARIQQGQGTMPILGQGARPPLSKPIDCHAVLMGFPPHISFGRFQSVLTLEVMEKIGERWYLRFGALKKYMERYGEEPPSDAKYEGFKIGSWLQAQRSAQKKGQLPQDRAKLLEDLGVQWGRSGNEERWLAHLHACSEYYKTERKLPGIGEVSPDGLNIGNWLTHQRRFFKKGSLPQRRIKLFEQYLGRVWDPIRERWERNFAVYKDYVQTMGRQPDKRTVHNGVQLGNWLTNTVRPNKGKLSTEQVHRLDALGMKWERRSPRRRDGEGGTKSGPPRDYGYLQTDSSARPDDWFLFYERYRSLLASHDEMSYSANLFWKGRNLQAWFEEQVRWWRQGLLPPDKTLLIEKLLTFRNWLDRRRGKTKQ